MSVLKHSVCLLALFAIFRQTSGANLDQNRQRRQNEQDDALVNENVADETVSLDDLVIANRKHGWTTCDWMGDPKFSCNDCYTRVICKPIGGILKACGDSTPYCRNGFCSAVPSDECAIVEEVQEHSDVEIEDASEVESVEEEEADETVPLDLIIATRKHGWTACKWRGAPKFSCNDCNTRVICKPIGGILKACGGSTPYCRNGFCSAVPSEECAIVEEEQGDSEVEAVSEVEPVEEEVSEVETVDEEISEIGGELEIIEEEVKDVGTIGEVSNEPVDEETSNVEGEEENVAEIEATEEEVDEIEKVEEIVSEVDPVEEAEDNEVQATSYVEGEEKVAEVEPTEGEVDEIEKVEEIISEVEPIEEAQENEVEATSVVEDENKDNIDIEAVEEYSYNETVEEEVTEDVN